MKDYMREFGGSGGEGGRVGPRPDLGMAVLLVRNAAGRGASATRVSER